MAVQVKHRMKQPPRETLAFLAGKVRKLVTRRSAEEKAAERAVHVNNWLGAVNPDLPLPLRQARIAGDAALLAFRPRFYPARSHFFAPERQAMSFHPARAISGAGS